MAYNSYRGRGRGRGSWKQHGPPQPSVALPAERDMMESLKTVAIGGIDKHSMCFVGAADASGKATARSSSPAHSGDITFDDVKLLGSYNWTDVSGQIIVPGSPRLWKNVPVPFTAKKDSELKPNGTVFVDQNSNRFPTAPLLPLFAAVDEVQATSPDAGVPFDWASADVISDRNGLRKLIRWAEDSEKLKDFRIDVELVGYRTVLLGRWEKRNIEAANPWSFGFGFEHVTTREANGCEGATGHHRIVTYDFAGLQMVVRYEVDAAYASSAVRMQKPTSAANADDLADLLAATSLKTGSKAVRTTVEGLTIVRAGTLVPQADVLELTTRSVRNAPDFDWAEALPQLHLSRTPTHILGVHERGTFEELRITNLGSTSMRSAEAAAQRGLRKLRQVLEVIQDMLLEDAVGKRLTLVCKDGKMKVYERTGKGLLPEGILARFDK